MSEPILFEPFAEIWQLLADSYSDYVAIELCDLETKELQVSLLDSRSLLFNYTFLEPAPEKWQRLNGICKGFIWLIDYPDANLPLAKGVSVYNAEGRIIWTDPEFQVVKQENNRLWGYRKNEWGYYFLEGPPIFFIGKNDMGEDIINEPVAISFSISGQKRGYKEALNLLNAVADAEVWYAENNDGFGIIQYSKSNGIKGAWCSNENTVYRFHLKDFINDLGGWSFVLKGTEILFLTHNKGFGIWKPLETDLGLS